MSPFRRRPKPAPRQATAYLMLARDRDGTALGLTIASSENLASYGKIERWERTPRPYAATSAPTLDEALAKIRRAIVMDAEPWPNDLAPLVQDLLSADTRDTEGAMTDSIERATALADAFARNVLAACARSLESTPEAVLEAIEREGRPAADDRLANAWRDLAREVFPAAMDAPRKLRRIVTGRSGPRPLWEDLADLEAGLGVSAAELFAVESSHDS